uniref:Uncharacterized protein n=1 Tax=Anguilla anguilla TaxID=7936 RepID=A0A0E9SC69_ANGAN
MFFPQGGSKRLRGSGFWIFIYLLIFIYIYLL